MPLSAANAVRVFIESIENWHKGIPSSVNPYPENTAEFLLYRKNQTDTIQWHEEDEIRRPDLPAEKLVEIKRHIDRLNQDRTDTVEKLDDLIAGLFQEVTPLPAARMNSETPAWLLDRMSILELKIYHMHEQAERQDVPQKHRDTCRYKLGILLEQREDMSCCLDELLSDIRLGNRYFKVYRQMKMYNDQALNPSLYNPAKA